MFAFNLRNMLPFSAQQGRAVHVPRNDDPRQSWRLIISTLTLEVFALVGALVVSLVCIFIAFQSVKAQQARFQVHHHQSIEFEVIEDVFKGSGLDLEDSRSQRTDLRCSTGNYAPIPLDDAQSLAYVMA